MKKTLFSFLLLIFCCSLSAQMAPPAEALEGKPVKVDKTEFLKYIYNYEKNPKTWVNEGTLPCIIDFYADWCAPCRRLAPTLEEIAKKYKGQLVVFKVDTEAQRELAAYFKIQSLPTLVFVPKDGVPQAAMGLMPQKEIEKIIKDVLKVSVLPAKKI